MDIFKKQFSLNLNPQTQNIKDNWPPCKRQATILYYNLDQSVNFPLSTSLTTPSNSSSGNLTQAMTPTVTVTASSPTVTTTANYNAKLLSIKTEVNLLWTIITMAVEQIKNAIASIQVHNLLSNAMETDADQSMETATPSKHTANLPSIIQECKHDLTTIVLETRALMQQQATMQMATKPGNSSVTWTPIGTSVGLLRLF